MHYRQCIYAGPVQNTGTAHSRCSRFGLCWSGSGPIQLTIVSTAYLFVWKLLCAKGERRLAGSGEEGATMQLSKGARTMGRVGALVASASSMLVFAGPASAAGDTATAYDYGHAQFSVQLTGDEIRDGGDRDGDAVARLDLDPYSERVCYVVTWRGLEGDVTDFHIHSAPRHNDGPVFLNLFNDRHFDGEYNTVAACVHSDESKIRDIIEDPSDYYLMLHTTAHHAGALRGQLD